MRYALLYLLLVGCSESFAGMVERSDDRARSPSAPPQQEEPTVADSESGYIGVIQIGHTVTVAPRVEGRIVDIAIKLGETVGPGQIVARVDAARYEHELDEAQAELRRLRTAHRRARSVEALRMRQRNTERYLVDNGAASEEALAAAVDQVDGARAERKQLAVSVKEQRQRIAWLAQQVANTEIRAEREGTVAAILLSRGDFAGPNRAVVKLRRGDKRRVLFAIPVDQRENARIGVPVAIRGEGNEIVCTGQIATMAPKVEPRAQLIRVAATITAGDAPLCAKDGLSVRVELLDSQPERATAGLNVQNPPQPTQPNPTIEPVVTPLRVQEPPRNLPDTQRGNHGCMAKTSPQSTAPQSAANPN